MISDNVTFNSQVQYNIRNVPSQEPHVKSDVTDSCVNGMHSTCKFTDLNSALTSVQSTSYKVNQSQGCIYCCDQDLSTLGFAETH